MNGKEGEGDSLRNELELVTWREICALLKISRRQLYDWRMAGMIPYFKIGKALRFRVGDVLAALEERRVG